MRQRPDQRREAVEPEAANIEERDPVVFLYLPQVASELLHSGDVVVVDVTDHGEINAQPVGGPAQSIEAGLQAVGIDAWRPAIDQPDPLGAVAGEPQDQAIAMLCLQCLNYCD